MEINVDVTDGDVSASDGAILNAFTADIDFSVDDNPAAVAAEVTGSNSSTDLDDAEFVTLSREAVSGSANESGLVPSDLP